MKNTKRQSASSNRLIVREKMNTLELYLMSCPNNSDKMEYNSIEEAREAGQKLIDLAIEEEGVVVRDQLQKFKIDITYNIVRIKLVIVSELTLR